MKPLFVLVAFAALSAAPVWAETAPAPAPATTTTTEAAPAPDPNKLICKTKLKTGSRFPERTCMTKAQWNDLWAKGRAITDGVQQRGYQANSRG